MRAAVIGMGHIGLVTALGLASLGNIIVGYDINANMRSQIKNGTIPYSEPELEDKLKEHIGTHFFVAETLADALQEQECILLCVGTPGKEDGNADLSALESATLQVVQNLTVSGNYTLAIRSTVFPGGIRQHIIPIVQKYSVPGVKIHVASNPEFLREANAWSDFCTATRTLIGADDPEAIHTIATLYEQLNSAIYAVSIETAEFAKYLSNCMLATMISFSNEMSLAARQLGNISIEDAFMFVQNDERWITGRMADYIYPGCGYGGYCLPKDTKAFSGRLQQMNMSMPILDAVIQMNDTIAERLVSLVCNQISPSSSIGILGLSFKPCSSDVRESPAANFIFLLQKAGFTNIHVFDYLANSEFQQYFPHIQVDYCESLSDISEKSDVFINLHSDISFIRFGEQTNKPFFDFKYCAKNRKE